jgi:hypothetical protein
MAATRFAQDSLKHDQRSSIRPMQVIEKDGERLFLRR